MVHIISSPHLYSLMKLQKMVPTVDTSLCNYRERDISMGDFQTDKFSFIKQTPFPILPSTTGKSCLLLLGFFQTSDMISCFFSVRNAQRYRMILSPW